MRTAMHGEDFRLVINGVEYPADNWRVDVTQAQADVTSIGQSVRQYAPGARTVTVTVDGVRLPVPPAVEPVQDIVTHVATRCCCGSCPQAGDHS